MTIKINRISRYGAYGVFIQDSKILLTLKKSGPYKGLWDLPGGGIEFGETPEEALKREFLEETALMVDQLELLCIGTANSEYDKDNHITQVKEGELCRFHHIGIIYKVSNVTVMSDLVPEEEGRFCAFKDIKLDELTPFAKLVLC